MGNSENLKHNFIFLFNKQLVNYFLTIIDVFNPLNQSGGSTDKSTLSEIINTDANPANANIKTTEAGTKTQIRVP